MLEDAEAAAVRREIRDRHRAAVVDSQNFAGSDIADKSRAHRLERARLARHQPGVALPAEAERAHAERVAHRVERGGGEDDE